MYSKSKLFLTHQDIDIKIFKVLKFLDKLPKAVEKYISDNFSCPAGIIGCRATHPEISFDCCEYDIAIFNKQSPTKNSIVRIDKYNIKLIYFPLVSKLNDLSLNGIIIFANNDNLDLFPINISRMHNYRLLLSAQGKNAIIRSLFIHEKINISIKKQQPILSAMWLKISAYYFLGGILALSGSKSMPIHELNQIRQMDIHRQEITDGIILALESIGLQRATRSSIKRSIEGVLYLNSTQYDSDFLATKIKYLLDKGLIADCYYYIGKIGMQNLLRRDEKFYKRYTKLIQNSLDLITESGEIQQLNTNLFAVSKKVLKN